MTERGEVSSLGTSLRYLRCVCLSDDNLSAVTLNFVKLFVAVKDIVRSDKVVALVLSVFNSLIISGVKNEGAFYDAIIFGYFPCLLFWLIGSNLVTKF